MLRVVPVPGRFLLNPLMNIDRDSAVNIKEKREALMSTIFCDKCGTNWNAEFIPVCPRCLANVWGLAPNIIKQKHDPSHLPSTYPSFRSVLSNEFVEREEEFLYFAAASGTAYYSNKHKEYFYYTQTPLGIIPGSAVPRNQPWPTEQLNGLLIADPFGDPHAYAEGQVEFQAKINSGEIRPLYECDEPGCHNKCIPEAEKCIEHNVTNSSESEGD